jgi:hypothetical protein
MVLPSPVGESVAANFRQRSPAYAAFTSDRAGLFFSCSIRAFYKSAY